MDICTTAAINACPIELSPVVVVVVALNWIKLISPFCGGGGGHHYHPSSDLILITGYGFATDYNTYFKLLQFYNNPTERRKTIKT